ncbi:hypothetical protein A7U43_18385 [Mycobacterium adipatum]|uniref:Uncharacterized protein n=1 Tax=Mycobacterium adipatum TaxID=1682113 RepID=A0A172UPJ3_9MYCO|nr:hypothetical protein [Mycobacterium adipatum]ANE80995.1 hypothetical protein A7U43_18385 [Mycobacterium adipatum]MBI5739063.1 hypothetical protein [Mycolicibacterium neoaurum]
MNEHPSRAKILRNDLPEPDAVRLLVDEGQVDVAVLVSAGQVQGTLDRELLQSADGTVTTTWSTRIDGVREGNAGLADVQTDEAELLRDLAAVAVALADELAGSTGDGGA